jgi:tetratricopeptide (TPR) repeat protein
MQNKQGIIIAIVIVIILIGGAWYFNSHPSSPASQIATTTPTISTSTQTSGTEGTAPASPSPAASKPAPAPTTYATNALPISSKDTLVSWSFKGSYEDGGALQQKATSQIATLKAQLNNSDPTIQEKLISIAEEYDLIGDGQSAYNYFLQALNSTQRYEQEDGIAWVRLGDLMQTLKAYYTAVTAYANAVAADPGEPSFHVARIQFLTSYLPKETALINAAFTDANKDVPGDASVAQLQAQYQKAQTQ